MNHDRFNLDRFVRAQADAYDTAIGELRRGRKTSHWMWFVFPQLRALGSSMHVAIFCAVARTIDSEYSHVAQRMRELALTQFGCLEFQSVTEGRNEVALSYWKDEASIRAWKAHAEHVLAQELGQARWYESYVVQVAAVTREYRYPASDGSRTDN